VDSESINDIFAGILSASSDEDTRAFEAAKDRPEMAMALKALEDRNPDRFYMSLLYPLKKVVKGLIAAGISRSQDVEFILLHKEFVAAHIRRLIEKHEGGACSADKVRTIMSAALRYYADQKPIVFNYSGEYVYQLPKVIFRDQSSILGFINGLQHLYFGNPEPYLQQLLMVSSTAAQVTNSEQG